MRPGSPDPMPTGGFTLLEVLVATIIVGIALGVALAAISQSRGALWRGERVREATQLLVPAAAMVAAEGELSEEEIAKGHPGWDIETQDSSQVEIDLTDDNGTPIPLGSMSWRRVDVTAIAPDHTRYTVWWIERGDKGP